MKADLASLGVELRDTQNVIQPFFNTLEHREIGYDWSKKSVSRMTEILMAEGAREEVSNTLTRTVDTSISRVEKGLKLRQSNFGYENKKIVDITGKEVFIQVRNQIEAPWIEAIFEKTIEGVMTDQEIVDYVNAMGYKSRIRKKRGAERIVVGSTGGIKLDVKQLQKYRANPIYCGVNIEIWGKTKTKKIVTKTSYDGLVNIEKFNKANKGKVYVEELPGNKVQVLYNLKLDKIIKRRNKFRAEYVFKNVVLCDICREPLLASESKGKSGKYFSFYHCQRKHKYFAVPQKELDKSMMTFLSRLKFSDKYYPVFERVLTWRYKEEQEKSLGTQITLNENIASIQMQIKQTLDAFKTVTNANMKKQFEQDYEKLEEDLVKAKIERRKLELDYDDLVSFLKYAKNLMEHPIGMFLNVSSYNEQMAIYKILFTEFPTYSDIVNGTPKISLFFKVLSESDSEKSLSVTLRGIEPRFQP
jgi:hypothetical protein